MTETLAEKTCTPCRGGITHHNGELTTLTEQRPGVETLLEVVLARAERA